MCGDISIMFEKLISRIDYFTKGFDFLIKDNAWIDRQNKFFHSGKCEGSCGRSNVPLNYAHKDPKHENYEGDIGGTGRGKNKRLLNFIKYPERYSLLCSDCHKKQHSFYKKHGTTEGYPTTPDPIKRDKVAQMAANREKKLLKKPKPFGGK